MKNISSSVIIFLFFLSSCNTSKKTESSLFGSFSKDTTIQSVLAEKMDYRIQKKDLLKIVVSSLNPEEDALFNSPQLSSLSQGDLGQYRVDDEGNIKFHMIGTLYVEGMTLKMLVKKIETELLPFMKEPIVNSEVLNHKIILLGEIEGQKVIPLKSDETLTLPEAIALAGNFKDNADLQNILVIRDSSGSKILKHLSLSDHSIFNSPFYYLVNGDIVYVTPDKRKVSKDNREKSYQRIIATLSGVSILIYIFDRIFR